MKGMAAFFSLVVILLLLRGGSLEEDHGICTLHDSGTNQVMYFLETLFLGQQHQIMAYCTSFNNELQGPDCNIHRGFMVSVVSTGGGPIMNMDYAVLEEKHEPEHEINMPKLGFPISYWNFGSQDTYGTTYISFHIFRSMVKMEPSVLGPNCGHYHHGCRLRDDAKLCAPSGTCLLQTSDKLSLDYLDMALYVNEYHATSGYFFVKKGPKVGVYPITFEALLHGSDQYANRRTPKLEFADVEQFHVIENFPTQNYQDHFFSFDPHYGCFALLFWEGSRSKAPEVHYYLFDESRPSDNVQLVDKIVLHDFDFYDIFDASKGYHDNIMRFPVFKSFGRQVFIGLPHLRAPQVGQQQQQSHPEDKVHRYRIWTPNPSESRYSDNVRIHHDVQSAGTERRTFVIDGRFIRTEKAKLSEPSTTTAKTTTTTKKTTAAPTTAETTTTTTNAKITTAPTTTTVASTTTTTVATEAPSSTTPTTSSTTATSTSTLSSSTTTSVSTSTAPETSTTTFPSTTVYADRGLPGGDDYGDEAHGNDNQNGETSDASGFWSCPIYNSWWGLTLFIIICSILGIVIVGMCVVILIGRRKEQIYGKKKEKKDKKKGGASKKSGEKQDSASGKVVGELDGGKPDGKAPGKNAATASGKRDGGKKNEKKKGAGRGSSKKEKKNASSTKEKKLDAKKDEQQKAGSSKKVKKNLSVKEKKNKK